MSHQRERENETAASFTERLKELIESGYGLMEQEASPALNESKAQPQEV